MAELLEIEELKKHFGSKVQEVDVRSAKRATLTVEPDAIVAISEFLYRELKFRFIISTAMETGLGIEILYHFSNDHTGLILNVRVILDKQDPVIESLTGLFEGANWIEREMHEIIGIRFSNHPNLEKLISDGNWAEGIYPYRKHQQ
jgi:NADH-quinone oxidoreductase subunit C